MINRVIPSEVSELPLETGESATPIGCDESLALLADTVSNDCDRLVIGLLNLSRSQSPGLLGRSLVKFITFWLTKFSLR